MKAKSKDVKGWSLTGTWLILQVLHIFSFIAALLLLASVVWSAIVGIWNGSMAGVPEPDMHSIHALLVFTAMAIVTGFGTLAIEEWQESQVAALQIEKATS